MEQALFTAQSLLEQLPLFVVAILILWCAKVVYDLTTKYSFDEELVERDNSAVGVSLAGYLLGVGFALKGVFADMAINPEIIMVENEAGEMVEAAASSPLLDIAINGVLIIILMRLSVWISDKCILYKFKMEKEIIDDRNSGTGFVVAGSCIATGLMLCGVLSGESASTGEMIRDIVLYWAIGQTLLVIGAKFYTFVTRYDVHEVIENDDNVSAGLCFGAYLLAQGVIAYGSLNGASGAIVNELIITSVAGIIGMILLVTSSVVVDKAFLPKSCLVKEIVEDQNIAAGATVAAIFVTVGITLANVISASI